MKGGGGAGIADGENDCGWFVNDGGSLSVNTHNQRVFYAGEGTRFNISLFSFSSRTSLSHLEKKNNST